MVLELPKFTIKSSKTKVVLEIHKCVKHNKKTLKGYAV